jgi:signal transduction histidine kinase
MLNPFRLAVSTPLAALSRKPIIRLKTALVVPFVVQVVGITGLIGYLSFRNGQQAVSTVVVQLKQDIGNRIQDNLTAFLKEPSYVNQVVANELKHHHLQSDDFSKLEHFLWQQLNVFDSVTLVGLGTEKGAFIGVEHMPNGDRVARIVKEASGHTAGDLMKSYRLQSNGQRSSQLAEEVAYNPRDRPWYKITAAVGEMNWSPVFARRAGRTLAIASSYPIYAPSGQLEGVLTSLFNLSRVGEFLRTLKVGQSGQTFIIDRTGLLVAASIPADPFTVDGETMHRLSAANSQDPVTQATAQFLHHHFGDFSRIQTQQSLVIPAVGQRWFAQVIPFQDPKGIDWLIVITVPESDFMGQIEANRRTTILLCVVALGLAMGLGIITTRWMARPILRLNHASKAMAAGQLVQQVPASVVQELGEMAQSFNQMAYQLQKSFDNLEQANTQLEIRVVERTAQLQSAKEEVETALKDLQIAQTQLIQTEKMSSLGQLVAGVAHEINNPVSFIAGNLEPAEAYLQDLMKLLQAYQIHYPQPVPEISALAQDIELEFLSQDLPKLIESMKVGVSRIHEIVLALRIFSRLDEADVKAVDIHEGIDSTLMILASRLKAVPSRPAIEVNRTYGPLPKVECYAGQLNQVFMNILANAIDALEEGVRLGKTLHPLLTIQTTLVDGLPEGMAGQTPNRSWVEICIQDNGIGIPPATRQRIFDPFFTTKPIGVGTGMGLAISYQIVTERHQGHLECHSTPGQGTRFVVTIPLGQKDKGRPGH